MRLRFVHASLKHDADRDAVAAWLAALVAGRRLHVLTCTEAQQPGIRRVLARRLGRAYRVRRRGEYLIVTHRRTLRAASVPRLWLLSTRAKNGLPGWRQVRVAADTYRVAGRRLRIMVGHMPAGVESGDSWRADRPSAAAVTCAQEGYSRWGARIRRGARRGVVQVAALDANLDQRRDGWRRWVSTRLGPSVWAGRVPDRGTHGHRLIDTAHITGARVVAAGIPAANADRPRRLDHAAIAYVIELDPLMQHQTKETS